MYQCDDSGSPNLSERGPGWAIEQRGDYFDEQVRPERQPLQRLQEKRGVKAAHRCMSTTQMTKTAIAGATINTRFATGLVGAGCGLVSMVAKMALVNPNALAILRSPRKTNLQGQKDQEEQCYELCHENNST